MLTGDDDRPPVRLSVPQAYLHACADGAVGALIAIMSECAPDSGSMSTCRRSKRSRWRRNRYPRRRARRQWRRACAAA